MSTLDRLGPAWEVYIDQDLCNHLKVYRQGHFILANHVNQAASIANYHLKIQLQDEVSTVFHPTIDRLAKILQEV